MKTGYSKTVVILGMHRSGTSMAGGILTRLGVDMGEDLPGKQASNPLGHFEDGAFLTLNEKILESAGGSWDLPPSSGQIDKHGINFQNRIKRLLHERDQLHPHGIWGWKDPRTSLTIGLYSPFIDDLKILWCQRDPEGIADSLQKRNGFSREKSLGLCNLYNQRIAAFLEGNSDTPVLELPYQDLIFSPLAWIGKIVDFLEIQPTTEQIEEAAAFILPQKSIHKARAALRWRYLLSLPLRALRKVWSLLNPS